ncbi:MAG: hypothetical protein P4L84_22765 [Isosphaeraceae bacterium]|nr:hypothetical protein [Isosphaeraceae bacterium]
MWKYLKKRKNLGALALGGWLVIFGLSQAIQLSFLFRDQILGAIAIVAGALVLLDR